ncbi:MAG TPA: transposase [Coxiellaceae bacterium]|nr:transposase [Coxiellaceae bacterium]
MQKNPDQFPFAYFLTYTTYGTWLHGDQRKSVDSKHNVFLTPKIKQNPGLHRFKAQRMLEDPYCLNDDDRKIVLREIIDTCGYYDWELFAAHARTNHVHLVLSANDKPENVMGKLKAYASRALNKKYGKKRKYWTHHGSTRYIWTSTFLFPVMRYIIDDQGERMACYYQKNLYESGLDQANWDF